MPLPLAIPLIAAGIQGATGLYQTWKGKKMHEDAQAKFDANPYQIPEGATRSVALAGRAAQSTRLPGQDIMEEGIAGRTAQTIGAARRAATSPSQILASTVAAYGQQQQANQNLDLQAAQDYQRRQGIYANAVAGLSGFQTEKWKYSTLYPYQSGLNAAGQFSATGQQNMGQALQSGLSLAANQAYLSGITPPTNGMEKGSLITNQKTISQLPSEQLKQGLMPMNSVRSYPSGDFSPMEEIPNIQSKHIMNTGIKRDSLGAMPNGIQRFTQSDRNYLNNQAAANRIFDNQNQWDW